MYLSFKIIKDSKNEDIRRFVDLIFINNQATLYSITWRFNVIVTINILTKIQHGTFQRIINKNDYTCTYLNRIKIKQ